RALALWRKALEARAALHQHDAQNFLKLLEAGRHRRLGDAAGLGRPAEMALLGQRQQKFELVDQESSLVPIGEIPAMNITLGAGQTRLMALPTGVEPAYHSVLASPNHTSVSIAI